jgi:hypothetical protein
MAVVYGCCNTILFSSTNFHLTEFLKRTYFFLHFWHFLSIRDLAFALPLLLFLLLKFWFFSTAGVLKWLDWYLNRLKLLFWISLNYSTMLLLSKNSFHWFALWSVEQLTAFIQSSYLITEALTLFVNCNLLDDTCAFCLFVSTYDLASQLTHFNVSSERLSCWAEYYAGFVIARQWDIGFAIISSLELLLLYSFMAHLQQIFWLVSFSYLLFC